MYCENQRFMCRVFQTVVSLYNIIKEKSMNTALTIVQHIQSGTSDWESILSDTLALFNCPTGTLHCLNSETQILSLIAQRGLPEAILPMVTHIPVGKGMAGICAERREVVQTCNLQTDTSGVVRPGAKETRMEGAITVPIIANNELLGTLGIAKPIPYDFSSDETTSLTLISEAIGAVWVA